MTREQVYKSQLEALGIYNEAFDPEIKTLAQLERELTRTQKEWKAHAEAAGREKSMLDPFYALIQAQRKEILQHREALGLTPKALQRLKGRPSDGGPESEKTQISKRLDDIAARVKAYE